MPTIAMRPSDVFSSLINVAALLFAYLLEMFNRDVLRQGQAVQYFGFYHHDVQSLLPQVI